MVFAGSMPFSGLLTLKIQRQRGGNRTPDQSDVPAIVGQVMAVCSSALILGSVENGRALKCAWKEVAVGQGEIRMPGD